MDELLGIPKPPDDDTEPQFNAPQNRLKKIDAQEIDEALSSAYRVYFTGELSRPQALSKSFDSVKVESGKSRYEHDKADIPHMHMWNTELNFVVAGTVKVVLLATGEEHEMAAGSMFVIEPGTPYVTKGKAGSESIFVKVPGGNDKRELHNEELPAGFTTWSASYDAKWDSSAADIGVGETRDENWPYGDGLLG